ncbi:polyprenyl synthetase family protein [Marinicella sp. W31]|uniref:polyprenyl synthetase family protein n=1 Tax=Marinicella sp. W31 TaxID=3023713 RepID=UPI0037575135
MTEPQQVISFSEHHRQRINHFLAHQLEQLAPQSSRLKEAVAYALLSGGKRIRPLLVYAVADMIQADMQSADHIAASIEMIHAYSLIHDDLPAMDDDDLRRGQPTCHIQFDEATAILAGDALQAMAFELLSHTPAEPSTIVSLIQYLTRACGMNGMAGGQSLDLEAEDKTLQLTELENIHALKTGALLSACVDITVLLKPGLTESTAQQLNLFGRNFGVAFQIVDDILDLTSDTQTLGKPAGSDTENNKSTYPQLLGLDQAREKAREHIETSRTALHATGLDGQHLLDLCTKILNRNN